MCALQLPMSQLMSNTSVMAIADFYRGGGGARDHPPPPLAQ